LPSITVEGTGKWDNGVHLFGHKNTHVEDELFNLVTAKIPSNTNEHEDLQDDVYGNDIPPPVKTFTSPPLETLLCEISLSPVTIRQPRFRNVQSRLSSVAKTLSFAHRTILEYHLNSVRWGCDILIGTPNHMSELIDWNSFGLFDVKLFYVSDTATASKFGFQVSTAAPKNHFMPKICQHQKGDKLLFLVTFCPPQFDS
jgi:hypothetical protein